MKSALIVGAGFSGLSAARVLADTDEWYVHVVDQRDHIGGNAYDRNYEDTGLLYHPYGPHIFHTNADRVVKFLSRFTEWHPYEHRVTAWIDGNYVPVPVNWTTIETMYPSWARNLRSEEDVERFMKVITAEYAEKFKRPSNSKQSVLVRMGDLFYKKIFEPYTTKQWGVRPEELDAGVCARIPIRYNRDDRYFTDEFQAMPKSGYTKMFLAMVDHENIGIELGLSMGAGNWDDYDAVLWSGPIDEYFGYELGKLPYRSAMFAHIADKDISLPTPQVNYPNRKYPHTREYEVSQMTGQNSPSGVTVITRETPVAHRTEENEPMWPIPAPANRKLYSEYKELAEQIAPKVHFFGRLGSYQYLDMHQACAQGMHAAETTLEEHEGSRSASRS